METVERLGLLSDRRAEGERFADVDDVEALESCLNGLRCLQGAASAQIPCHASEAPHAEPETLDTLEVEGSDNRPLSIDEEVRLWCP